MSNPYSSQSISGYNASPPPDDGSATTANQITWAKHKTKLADPVKTLAEGINSAVSTAFGRIFLNAAVSKSTDYTVTESDQGKLINVTNTTTITLPASGSVGPNFTIAIRNAGSGTVTIDGNSSELINGAVTQSLGPGNGIIIMSDGNGWFAMATLDGGVTATVAELNILDGVTATTAELNILDGVTSTTAELNILDGVTATASELNRVDGTVNEVQENIGIYCGYVDSSAAAEIVPSGWSVVNGSAGVYTVTHNLGLSTPVSDLIITATVAESGAIDRVCTLHGWSANTFTIEVYDVTANALTNAGFHFTAVKRA